MIIDERVETVRLMLGNRLDLDPRILRWIANSYLELGMAYKFAELEDSYDETMVVGTSVYDYPVTSVAGGSRTSGYETRAIRTMSVIDTSDNPRPLRRRNKDLVDRYKSTTQGPPSIYAPWGQQVILRPVPDLAYTLRWNIWLKPRIETNPGASVILLPDDWLEILDLIAAMRGHAELLERDKADELFRILHGPEDPRSGRRHPGLIAQRLTQRAAEFEAEEYGVRPNIRRYTA